MARWIEAQAGLSGYAFGVGCYGEALKRGAYTVGGIGLSAGLFGYILPRVPALPTLLNRASSLFGRHVNAVISKAVDFSGRVITRNGIPIKIRGKSISPHAVRQAVERGVRARDIVRVLDEGVPKARISPTTGELELNRRVGEVLVGTTGDDVIVKTIIQSSSPRF